MKKLLLTVLALTSGVFAQNFSRVEGGRFFATAYSQYRFSISAGGSSSSGAFSIQLNTGMVALPDGKVFSPITTATPIVVGLGSLAETVTPSTVSNCNVAGSGNLCTITATFANAHLPGEPVSSGSYGLQEAINEAKTSGGIAVVDSSFGGTTSTITGASGASNTYIEDLRAGGPVVYAWTGSAYKAVAQPFVSPAAGMLVPFINEENLTLSTGGATTDTTANLLPANSVILGVFGRVTTTISGGTCSGWQLGDPTTAGRFTASDTTLTAGETMPKSANPPVHIGTGIASATTGMYQGAAAKVRVTCATGAAGAGVVRITAVGWTIIPPTS